MTMNEGRALVPYTFYRVPNTAISSRADVSKVIQLTRPTYGLVTLLVMVSPVSHTGSRLVHTKS